MWMPARTRWLPLGSGGFTLVELVVVMIVMGILAVTILPRFTDTAAFDEAGFHAQVVAGLRYAQKTAVSHRRLVCAEVTSNSLTLQIAASNPALACGTALLRAPDGAAAFASSASINLGLTAGALPATLHFQPDGRITTDAAGTTLWGAGLTVTGMANITVTGATGYVK